MKKIISIIAVIAVSMFVFVGCNNNNQVVDDNTNQNNSQVNVENNQNNNENENQNVESNNSSGSIIIEPFNKEADIGNALTKISSVTGLDDSTKMSEADIKANFDFGKYEGLQKEVRSKITEDGIKEIVIIKVGENEQASELFTIIANRQNALRQKYADNENITSILSNGQYIVMKQEAGILVSIVAENASEISDSLKEAL